MQNEKSSIRLKRRLAIKSEELSPTPTYFSKYFPKRNYFFFVRRVIQQDSNQPNFEPDWMALFFGLGTREKL